MSKYRPTGCTKCKQPSQPGCGPEVPCQDVCTDAICGLPNLLTLLAPVVYDEIGINLCRTIPLGLDLATTFPTAVYASAEVIAVTFDVAPEGGTTDPTPITTTVTPIPGRPNCYEVVLTNLRVTFAIKLYDCTRKLLTTLTESAVYLAPNNQVPDFAYYDEDTNPSSVELEIYAPYGVAYTDGNVNLPALQAVCFSTTNNMLTQGLNLMAIPKVLSLDTTDSAITVGLSLYLKSIYFAQYRFSHQGRAQVPKGSLLPPEDSICMDFVSGGLLDLNIKPLELGCPVFDEDKKLPCQPEPCAPCSSPKPPTPLSESPLLKELPPLAGQTLDFLPAEETENSTES